LVWSLSETGVVSLLSLMVASDENSVSGLGLNDRLVNEFPK